MGYLNNLKQQLQPYIKAFKKVFSLIRTLLELYELINILLKLDDLINNHEHLKEFVANIIDLIMEFLGIS